VPRFPPVELSHLRVPGRHLEALLNPRLLTVGGRRKGLTRNFPRHRRAWHVEQVLVLAHRGANRHAPENTVPAMVRALELGADGVELDVHRTADGHLVVRHDADTPVGALGELTLAEIAAALPEVPTLAAVLDVCRGKLVNVEVKDPDPRAVDVLISLLGARDGVDDVLVSSFHLSTVARVRATAPEVPTGFLSSLRLDPFAALVTAVEHGHTALHPHVWSLPDPAGVAARAHDRGLRVTVWTVNEPDQLLRLRDAGIDAVITDVPDVALDVLSA
jgi:glycerophosphoryl diester phosphodiesterase